MTTINRTTDPGIAQVTYEVAPPHCVGQITYALADVQLPHNLNPGSVPRSQPGPKEACWWLNQLALVGTRDGLSL